MSSVTIRPAKVGGQVAVPASKSQTIRALIIASFAEGTSIINHPLDSGDTRSCLDACRALGADITLEPERWSVRGIDLDKKVSRDPLVIDAGNSGTTLYLGLGAAASLGRPVIFTGDEQIRSRPLASLASSLQDLGAAIEIPPKELSLPPALLEGSAPRMITGPLTGGHTSISCPTSQYLSGLLLACPMAKGESVIEVPLLHERPYVEMTLSWLDDQGITYSREGWTRFTLKGGERFHRFESRIAGDFSSASFFFCAAAVTGSTLEVTCLDKEDPQGDREILTCLEQMGCRIRWHGSDRLTITGPAGGRLTPAKLDLNAIPDTLPVLAVTACFAEGTTVLEHVPQARIKETDRIAVMNRELTSLGARVEELEEGLVIHGTGFLEGGSARGHGDHRVIMALAVAGLASRRGVSIDDTSAADITVPGFFSLLDSIILP